MPEHPPRIQTNQGAIVWFLYNRPRSARICGIRLPIARFQVPADCYTGERKKKGSDKDAFHRSHADCKIGYIGISVLLTALGICLICVPDISVRAVGIVCGVTLIVFGIVKLVGYFSRDLFRLAFQYDLASGILTVLIGTALLIRPVRAMTLMCSLIGILVLADSLFKTQISIDARTFGVRQWWLILASAILAGGVRIFAHSPPG